MSKPTPSIDPNDFLEKGTLEFSSDFPKPNRETVNSTIQGFQTLPSKLGHDSLVQKISQSPGNLKTSLTLHDLL
jgi:hypothetical protein